LGYQSIRFRGTFPRKFICLNSYLFFGLIATNASFS
jgi:hypothetical protein